MDKLIGKTIGGCRIESKIGQGGMGAVYKAHHLALDVPVAIKILQPLSALEGAEERFLREARIAAKLRHPHVVGVHNVGCEKGMHYIIMDYIRGKNLLSIIKETGRIAPDEAVRIGIEVLEALQFAMENGVVHRDIKPENILLDNGSVRLADLGLARIAGDPSLTQSNTVLGSPHYVAPEQAENPGAADCRSDIYSLGCTLYHMMAGNVPYQGSTPVEIILNHIKTPAPILHIVNPSIPETLSRVVAAMMEKDPNARIKTPKAAIAALKNALENSGKQVMADQKGNKIPRSTQIIAYASLTISVFLLSFLLLRIAFNDAQAVSEPSDSLNVNEEPISAPVSESNTPKPSENIRKSTKKKPVQPKKTSSEPVSKPSRKVNPVLEAVKIGDTGELRKLLSRGASPDAAAGSPTTPLHEAVRRGSSEQTEILLRGGAKPNVRDLKGDAPLHYALRENATLIVKILLKFGADPNFSDRKGKTPMEIASGVDSELEKVLRQFGGR